MNYCTDEQFEITGLLPAHMDAMMRALEVSAGLAKGDASVIGRIPEMARRLEDVSVEAREGFDQLVKDISTVLVSRISTDIAEAHLSALNDLSATITGARGSGDMLLTMPQTRLMVETLDNYSRFGIGQLRPEEHPVVHDTIINRADGALLRERMEGGGLLLRCYVMPELNGPGHSYGIHSDSVCDEARISWDVQKVLRHAVAWRIHEANPTGERPFGVHYDTPTVTNKSGLSLPTARALGPAAEVLPQVR